MYSEVNLLGGIVLNISEGLYNHNPDYEQVYIDIQRAKKTLQTIEEAVLRRLNDKEQN